MHLARKSLKKLKRTFYSRRALKTFTGFALVFVLLNLSLWLFYRNHSYPNTQIGNQKLGSVASSKLTNSINGLSLLPDSVTLTYQEKSTRVSLQDLAIQLDSTKIAQHVVSSKHWMAVLNFFVAHDTPILLKVDEPIFQKEVDKLAQVYKQDATDAKVVLQNGSFSLAKEVAGYKLNTKLAQLVILQNITAQKANIALPTDVVSPKTTFANLTPTLQSLQTQQNVSLTYRFQTKAQKLTPQEIANWYVPEGSSYKLSDSKITDYVAQMGASFGIRVQNLPQALVSTKEAIQNNKPLDFTLVPAPAVRKSYSYCVALKNVDASYQAEFENKIWAVYQNINGWSLGGLVAFSQATSDCNFTVWLSAADQVPTFGSICDTAWSCRVGRNVVINFDRWRLGSNAWNQSGGGLDDYRSMVINHETGHWLGFGHLHCGGAGQLAPVMQQQSINLEGCKFNAWPLPSELSSLRKILGI